MKVDKSYLGKTVKLRTKWGKTIVGVIYHISPAGVVYIGNTLLQQGGIISIELLSPEDEEPEGD